jgi:hypothetical protein
MRKRATKQQIAVAIGILLAVAAAGFWWAPHIHWAYLLSRQDVKIAPVTVKELKASGQTAGWAKCRIGPLSFELPAEFAENATREVGKTAGTVTLTEGDLELSLFIPYRIPAGQKTSLMAMADELQMSVQDMVVAGYRSSTDDFRWTMSRDELRRHQKLLSLSQPGFFPHERGVFVETETDGAMKSVLILNAAEIAMLQWQAGAANGFLTFVHKKGKLDLEMVRNVCHSLACDESRLGDPFTKKAMRTALDAMEVTTP